MASWRFSIGNLVSRAAADPVAVAPATEDTLAPLANLGSGYPDQQGGLAWESDGTYDIDFDLNLLADESDAADAPTGYRDLLNVLAGTPGLPANPPDWGNYGTRNPALRFYRPVYQEIDVMPGETVKLLAGMYWVSAASTATGVRARVVSKATGKGWNGSAWASGGILETQLVGDTWKEITEQIDPDANVTERTSYYVILEPIAAAFGATTVCYASLNSAAGAPALIAEVDLCAIIGHNIPDDATVTLVPQPAGTTLTLTVAQPSMYVVGAAAQYVQTWRLSIAMPTGIQPRPLVGEVWIGSVRTLLGGSPIVPFSIAEGDPEQPRIEGARRRVQVLGNDAPMPAAMRLTFTFEHAAYEQARDEIVRLTRYGEEPLLLLPTEAFEGAGKVYHGRLGSEVTYQRISPGTTEALRTFGLDFTESPLPAP